MLHKNITTGDVHYIQNWSVADTTARDALSVAAADVGKVCQVTGTSSYYLLTDDSPMTWFDLTSTAGVGDVVGPGSATDNAAVRFDGTTGKLVQNSAVTIADTSGDITAGKYNTVAISGSSTPTLAVTGTTTVSGANTGDVTLDSTVTDLFSLTGQALSADDPNADRIYFWDDSAAKATHLEVSTGLAITGTALTATNQTQSLIVAASDEVTALTTGTAKVTFRMPYAFTLTAVRASLTTAQTSGNIFTVDINEGGSTILSTKITIDNTEKTSTTAVTPPVISDSSLADDAEMTIDIDQIGDGTAKGLKVTLIGTKT